MLLVVPRVYTMGFDLYMLVQPKNMLTSTSLSLPSSKSLDTYSTIVPSSTVPSFVLYLGFWELEKSERLMAVTAFKHTIIHFHFTALLHEDVKLVLTLCNSIYPLHIFWWIRSILKWFLAEDRICLSHDSSHDAVHAAAPWHTALPGLGGLITSST
jgi:hypothetical protein